MKYRMMHDTATALAYDAWLTTDPRSTSADAYDAWCEAEGLDPTDDHWADYEQHVADIHEDRELEMAEWRRDFRAELAEERYAEAGDW